MCASTPPCSERARSARADERRCRACFAALAIALGGCSAGPRIEALPGTSTRDARIALELAVVDGPVAGSVIGLPADSASEATILAEMGDAVAALPTQFAAEPGPSPLPTLIVQHARPPSADPCVVGPAAGDPSTISAAFCDGTNAVGAVFARVEGTPEVAVYRQLSRALFPDLWAETYGIRSGLGIGASSGSGGIGVGF